MNEFTGHNDELPIGKGNPDDLLLQMLGGTNFRGKLQLPSMNVLDASEANAFTAVFRQDGRTEDTLHGQHEDETGPDHRPEVADSVPDFFHKALGAGTCDFLAELAFGDTVRGVTSSHAHTPPAIHHKKGYIPPHTGPLPIPKMPDGLFNQIDKRHGRKH